MLRLAILLLPIAGACGSGPADKGLSEAAGSGFEGDVSFATTVGPLFMRSCSCHQTQPLMAPFSLKAAEAYRNTVGVPSSELPSMPRVAPGNLNNSYLWHKVNGTQLEVGGTGDIMPSNIPLFPNELILIERWIVAGAPP
jgi:hypothetical protein